MQTMKVKNLIAGGIAALSVLTACNDSFLDKAPIGSLGESNAFQTYDNFKAYMYNCYSLFTDKRIYTNFSGGSYYWGRNGRMASALCNLRRHIRTKISLCMGRVWMSVGSSPGIWCHGHHFPYGFQGIFCP